MSIAQIYGHENGLAKSNMGADGISDHLDLDSDNDGMLDVYELANGLNPAVNG